ncbi:MAG: metalloregulator ArsR/SmtB family transcription factor [Pseudomonadota bacterium]
MANNLHPGLDNLFQALADPTRRAVVTRLGEGPAPVKELASPHDMALPSFLKHLDMLERSGLVTSKKDGRVRICTLHPEAMAPLETWIEQQKRNWEGRLSRLDRLVEEALKGDDT